ncbi:MAG: hypothetical protein EP332_06375 [Bacteroidetes bacterium]|nr:MAG: hypothetical protein EP332_06375 [Bacteroidota bacterium]
MKLNDIVSTIISKAPIVSIDVNGRSIVKKYDTRDLEGFEEIKQFIIDSIKNEGINEKSEILVGLHRSNGRNATIFHKSLILDTKDILMVSKRPISNNSLYGLQLGLEDQNPAALHIGLLRDKITDQSEEILRLRSRNETLESENRDYRSQIAVHDRQSQLDAALGKIESEKSFGSILEKVIDSGIINDVLDKIGNNPNPKQIESSTSNNPNGQLFIEMTQGLSPDHLKYLLGIIKCYATEEAQAKQLFDLIYHSANAQTTNNNGDAEAKKQVVVP